MTIRRSTLQHLISQMGLLLLRVLRSGPGKIIKFTSFNALNIQTSTFRGATFFYHLSHLGIFYELQTLHTANLKDFTKNKYLFDKEKFEC
jgi:hypothetical protein